MTVVAQSLAAGDSFQRTTYRRWNAFCAISADWSQLMPNERTKLTPPALARRWGISVDKVLAWIRSGELRAFNAATRTGGRPRWLIDETDLIAFENRRSAKPLVRSRRRNLSPDVIPYF
jgi:hypothetical protein